MQCSPASTERRGETATPRSQDNPPEGHTSGDFWQVPGWRGFGSSNVLRAQDSVLEPPSRSVRPYPPRHVHPECAPLLEFSLRLPK